ncbi:MAG: sulfurtransferase [Acidobacteriota bacterium]
MPRRSTLRPLILCFVLFACAAHTVARTSADGVRHDLLISTDVLASQLDERVVLHVGDAESYAAGRIPGARHVPWSAIAVERDGIPGEFPPFEALVETFRRLGVGDGDRVVVYDTTRGIPATRAFLAFDLLGLGDQVALLDGQLAKWLAEGRPVEQGAAEKPIAAASLSVEPQPERLVAHDTLRRRIAEGLGAALVDARSAAEYDGSAPGNGIDPERGGHLPGAEHLFWGDHLAEGQLPVLAPVETLRRRFAAIGVDAGDPVVTYCRTGGKASHTYFVLRFLGHEDVAMYDGSFIQWQADAEAPVVRGSDPE